MELIKIVIMIAVTMALSITLTMTSIGNNNMEQAQEPKDSTGDQVVVSPGRVSRFLAEKATNPKAADHCKKDNDACYVHGLNATRCCNNKCVEVHDEDNNNCGGCKDKCKYTDTCCGGKCVNTDYDKRHCGVCGNKCKPGVLCLYGMCEYSI